MYTRVKNNFALLLVNVGGDTWVISVDQFQNVYFFVECLFLGIIYIFFRFTITFTVFRVLVLHLMFNKLKLKLLV